MGVMLIFLFFSREVDFTRFDGRSAVTQMVSQALVILISAVIASKFIQFSKIGFCGEGFAKGILLGWYAVLFIVLNIISGVSGMFSAESELLNPSALTIAAFALYCFLIGFFEEFLVRGIILNMLLNRCGGTKKGMYASVVLSGAIFGFVHLFNLLKTPDMIVATLTQAVYATFFGVFVGAVYLRTKNLWAVIALHSVYDFCAAVFDLLYTSAAAAEEIAKDIAVTEALAVIATTLPLLVLGFFFLRKVKDYGTVRDSVFGIVSEYKFLNGKNRKNGTVQ
jgi:CAAX amino terminal protease family.